MLGLAVFVVALTAVFGIFAAPRAQAAINEDWVQPNWRDGIGDNGTDDASRINCAFVSSARIVCEQKIGGVSGADDTYDFWYDPVNSKNNAGLDVFRADSGENDGDGDQGWIVCAQQGGYANGTCYALKDLTTETAQGYTSGRPVTGWSYKGIGLDPSKDWTIDNTGEYDKDPDWKGIEEADKDKICNIKMFSGDEPPPSTCINGFSGGEPVDVSTLSSFVSAFAIWRDADALKRACDNAVGILSFIICPIIGYMNNTILAMIGAENLPSGRLNGSFPAEGQTPTEPKGLLISLLEVRPLLAKVSSSGGSFGDAVAASGPAVTSGTCDDATDPGGADTAYTCSIKVMWNNMKNITLTVFILIFLVIIFANVATIGIDNYTIKKMLPRLVAAAILIQFSLLIVSLLVDIFNVLGKTVSELILSLAPATSVCPTVASGPSGTGAGKVVMGAGLGVGVTALLASPVGGPIALVGVVVIIVLVVMVAIAAIGAFIALLARQLIIFALVLTAPLAFAAWILPGTEKYFKLWRDNLIKSLAMFPIAVSMLAAAVLFSTTVIQVNACEQEFSLSTIMAALVPMVALLMLPKTFKWGGNLTSAIAGGIMGAAVARSKGVGSAASRYGKNQVKKGASGLKNAAQDRLSQTGFGQNTKTGRFLSGGGLFASYAGTTGSRQAVAARKNAAQSAADREAANLLRQANSLDADARNTNLSGRRRAAAARERDRIREKLYGSSATPAMRAAALNAAANAGDHQTLTAIHGEYSRRRNGAQEWQEALNSTGSHDAVAATMHAHAQTLAPGSAERNSINQMLTGAGATPKLRAAAVKTMAAAGDGAGLVAAHENTVRAGGQQAWLDAINANPGSMKAVADAVSTHASGMTGSIYAGAPDYNHDKAAALSVITGQQASPALRSAALGTLAKSGNEEGIEAVRQSIRAAHTDRTTGVVDEVAAGQEWARAVQANYGDFDKVPHLRPFADAERAGEAAKLTAGSFADVAGGVKKTLTRPEFLESTLSPKVITEATDVQRTSIPQAARENIGLWAHGAANEVDASGQPVMTAARRAAELRAAGHRTEADAVEARANEYKTVLDRNGNWTAPAAGAPAGSGGSSSAGTGSSGGSSTMPRGATGGHTGSVNASGLWVPNSSGGSTRSGSGPSTPPTPPPGGAAPPPPPTGGPGPSTPPPTGPTPPPGGAPPPPPPTASFDPLGSDLDPGYGANKEAQSRILADMAAGKSASEAAATHLDSGSSPFDIGELPGSSLPAGERSAWTPPSERAADWTPPTPLPAETPAPTSPIDDSVRSTASSSTTTTGTTVQSSSSDESNASGGKSVPASPTSGRATGSRVDAGSSVASDLARYDAETRARQAADRAKESARESSKETRKLIERTEKNRREDMRRLGNRIDGGGDTGTEAEAPQNDTSSEE